MAFATAKV